MEIGVFPVNIREIPLTLKRFNHYFCRNKKMIMKKSVVLSLSAVLMLSGCGTYTGSGAYAGASLGSILGSAIGGIAGGPRGSDLGTVIGMAGGAVIGSALGAQADQSTQNPARQHDDYGTYNDRRQDYSRGNDTGNSTDDSGFDPTNSGDDTIYDFNDSDYTGNYSATQPEKVVPSVRYDGIKAVRPQQEGLLEVRNARFVDDNQDGRLNAGELCKVIFEVYNTSDEVLTDVQPTVVETTGNRRIAVSQSIHIERIAPGRGIRYTAMVKADRRLRDGNSCFRVYAVQGNGKVVSNVCEFNVPTSRR